MTDTKRILLAEDDRFLRRACATALSRRGFLVVVAEDGEQAMQLAAAERPDLILLDLLMPKMSGVQVLQCLVADPALRDVPVMIMTNSSKDSDLRSNHGSNVVGYYVKADLSLQALGDLVARFFGGQP
jgi:CheY-like chemotaxis protein